MNPLNAPKKWILLGLMLIAGGLWLWRAPLPEKPAAMHPQNQPAATAPEVSTQAAASPAGTQQPPEEAPQLSNTAQPAKEVATPSQDTPVYIGHTDRVALQPEIVQALNQLIDTSHDGLQFRTLPNGAHAVNTRDKFRHVAVGAITPDGKILQQDFSSPPNSQIR